MTRKLQGSVCGGGPPPNPVTGRAAAFAPELFKPSGVEVVDTKHAGLHLPALQPEPRSDGNVADMFHSVESLGCGFSRLVWTATGTAVGVVDDEGRRDFRPNKMGGHHGSRTLFRDLSQLAPLRRC